MGKPNPGVASDVLHDLARPRQIVEEILIEDPLGSFKGGMRAARGRSGLGMVGVGGFEPSASRPQTARSAKLSYTPPSDWHRMMPARGPQ